MLALSLALPQAHAAPALAAACVDGYALWANSATRSDTLVVSGSNSAIGGAVRSNRTLKLSGSQNRFAGALTYASSFEDGGDGNSYPAPTRAPAEAPPLSYALADYRPGGPAAEAAAAAGLYTPVSGDLDVSRPAILSGLYYVRGNAKIGASDVRGSFTIVAEGMIDVSGSRLQASPYADGLLLFAGRSEPGGAVLKLAGGEGSLRGVIYAPGGMAELSGSGTTIVGAVLGDTIALNGSSLSIGAATEYCPGGPADEGAAFAEGEVLVKLGSAADLAAVAAAYALDPAPLGQFGTRAIYRLRIADGAGPQLKAAQLGGDPRVEYAEPNYLAQDPESRRGRGSWVLGAGPGGYAEQWAPALIGLPAAHSAGHTGAGVTVAVLDTGVDLDHPALAARLVPGFDFVDFDADPREVGAAGLDAGFGHGTHVAGLVALAAPSSRIMPVRVLDKDGVGNIWVLSEGLLFAAELGPDGVPLSGDEAQVINLSLGTLRPTRLLEDLVTELTCVTGGGNEDGDDDDDDDDPDEAEADQGAASARCRSTGGAVVLAAAGNGGDTAPEYPAAEDVPGSLAVGASTRLDTQAGFSSFGPWVRLAAPGEEVVSTVPGGEYGTWSGTSMAAPLAAGVAALVRSADPALSATGVTERLVATARPIAGPIGRRLDAAAAVGARGAADTAALPSVYLPLVVDAR